MKTRKMKKIYTYFFYHIFWMRIGRIIIWTDFKAYKKIYQMIYNYLKLKLILKPIWWPEKKLVKFSNQFYDFELKYLDIYITRSKTLYWFPKTFYLWTRWYNLYIYNFNNNGKIRGRKDIWCAKSEVFFFNFECVLHEIEGPGQKLFIDFQRHFIHN
jgi:hypothetical protein